jgi:HlyD family secretion protein
MPEQLRGKKAFKSGIRWLLASGTLVLVGAGGWIVYTLAQNRPAEPVAVTLVAAEVGDIESTINESGIVEFGAQQTLKSPGETTIDQVLVQPGDRVQAGQVLITLRNPQRETALASQQLKVQQKEVSLANAQQKIQELQEQLTIKERQLSNFRALQKEGALPQQRVIEQEDQVRSTRISLSETQAQVRTLSLERKDLLLERQRIQTELQNTVITAPISGVVLDVRVQDGDGVQFQNDLLTLGNPAQEMVKLQLSTLNARLVKVNQPVRVSVIGPDEEVFTGRVRSLYPQAVLPSSQNQSNNRSSEQATVPAVVKIDRPSRKLIPGSQVNVEIVVQSRRNVVTLDVEAIQKAKSQSFVWLRDGEGKAEKRPIETGLEGLLEVEVVSGLRSGEQVIVPTPDMTLQPGMPVTSKQASPDSSKN